MTTMFTSTATASTIASLVILYLSTVVVAREEHHGKHARHTKHSPRHSPSAATGFPSERMSPHHQDYCGMVLSKDQKRSRLYPCRYPQNACTIRADGEPWCQILDPLDDAAPALWSPPSPLHREGVSHYRVFQRSQSARHSLRHRQDSTGRTDREVPQIAAYRSAAAGLQGRHQRKSGASRRHLRGYFEDEENAEKATGSHAEHKESKPKHSTKGHHHHHQHHHDKKGKQHQHHEHHKKKHHSKTKHHGESGLNHHHHVVPDENQFLSVPSTADEVMLSFKHAKENEHHHNPLRRGSHDRYHGWHRCVPCSLHEAPF